ncbi:ABC transporter ATP-binding protein [Falsiroseomonas sp.]|uniref:ABC transporter ATP-binding protein n=1 Tax=Falsiroseomonas sp. TaxID=2870721 RepID=UPI003F6E7FCA
MTPSVLSARDLAAAYPGLVALRGVSLELAPAEALAVVGRSGCGKTTLGRMLAGLPVPGAELGGTLAWPGGAAPVAGARRRGLSGHVAWLPQEAIAALHPQLTIGTQVAETLRAAGRPADAGAVAACLAEVGLPAEFAARHPHRLSGGQGQRAALACCLAQSPAVLVADEPTSALDEATGAALLRLLAERRRAQGMALVLVTHDLPAATTLCDRMLVLQDGAIAEEGPAARLAHRPASSAGRELVAALRFGAAA